MTTVLKPTGFRKRYAMITWGVTLMVVGFHYFIAPFNLVIGGVSGVGLLIGETLNFSIAGVVFVLNVFLLGLGWLFLGRKSFIRSIYGSLVFPVVLFVLETWGPVFELPHDYVLAVVFGGGFMGLGFGTVIRFGGTSGGTDIPIKILHKRLKLPLSMSIYIVDGAIIFAGVLAFYTTNGLAGGLYALLTVILAGKVADVVVIGANRLTAVQIITDHPEPIKEAIYTRIFRGVSIVPIQGGYTGANKTMLITVITKDEYYTIRSIIAQLDPQAFVFTNPASEIQGDFARPFEEDL